MAEGLCRSLKGNEYSAYSAGIETHGLNPYAVKVMKEIGIDISEHYSKTLEDLQDVNFDIVLTVCDHANETCPIFSGNTDKRHHNFPDPPRLAKQYTDEHDILDVYRVVRDQIKNYIVNL
jgi:arsenate reductase